MIGYIPYQSPTEGTTATVVPDANGAFPQPVYYDWNANWDRVSELVSTQPVQAALERSVRDTSDGYYFDDWDEGKIWPFLFNLHRRYGNGEQDSLMREFLPREHVREMNGRVADWFRARGEEMLLSKEYNPKRLAEDCVASELEPESGVISEDEIAQWAQDNAEEMTDHLYDLIYHEASGEELRREIWKASEAVLYNKDSPLRATLLSR